MSMPGGFRCIWRDLNWVGSWGGNMPPNVSYLWFWLLGPLGFAKFYAPLSVLMVGLSVWVLFRQLRFKPWVGLLGALAAALNTDFFSYACWGLGTLTICMAWIFVAARYAHAYVHVTSNVVTTRFNLFGFGAFVLIAMWLIFAARILLAL